MPPQIPPRSANSRPAGRRIHDADAVLRCHLRRAFKCAGRTVYVLVAGLRSRTGEVLFDVVWVPSPPERLSSADIAMFDRSKAWAVTQLLAELEARP